MMSRPLLRLLLSLPLLGVFLFLIFQSGPDLRSKRRKSPWTVEPAQIVETVGARVQIRVFRFEPGEQAEREFDWKLEGAPDSASLSSTGLLTVPREASSFTVLATHRSQGDVLKIPVRIVPGFQGRWQPLPPLNHPRRDPLLVELDDGSVLVLSQRLPPGEWFDREELPPPELLDRDLKSIRVLAPLQQPRMGQSALKLKNGKVLVLGGLGSGREPVQLMECFDPETQTFFPVGNIRNTYQQPALIDLEHGEILVLGSSPAKGAEFKPAAEGLRWDATSQTYVSFAFPAPTAGFHSSLKLPSGRCLLLGYEGAALLDLATKSYKGFPWKWAQWAELGPEDRCHLLRVPRGGGRAYWEDIDLESGRSLHSHEMLARDGAGTTRLRNGALLFVGGRVASIPGHEVSSFDGVTGLRQLQPSLPFEAGRPGILRLRNGHVLVAGGYGADERSLGNLALFVLDRP